MGCALCDSFFQVKSNTCLPFEVAKIPKKVVPMDPKRKAEQTIRRLCKVNQRTGKRKVSESVAKQFFRGCKARKDLIALFEKSGGRKESQFNSFMVSVLFE